MRMETESLFLGSTMMQPLSDISLAYQCATTLGLTRTEVMEIARSAPMRYKIYTIPKRNGGDRLICQPSRELKTIQYYFLENILKNAPVHSCATAHDSPHF